MSEIKTIHWLKNISDDETACGIDTLKIAEGKDGMVLDKRRVTCGDCKDIIW